MGSSTSASARGTSRRNAAGVGRAGAVRISRQVALPHGPAGAPNGPGLGVAPATASVGRSAGYATLPARGCAGGRLGPNLDLAAFLQLVLTVDYNHLSWPDAARHLDVVAFRHSDGDRA